MYSEASDSSDLSEIGDAIGQSEAFLAFQEQLSRVAPVERPVLIVGERGTGKELAAKRIHFLSGRWQEPLVELNCAALTPTLIESELFGHETGAFTGATVRRRGRFEAANGGTLFLDELGNIPLPVQEKILRVVEYGAFERVGGSEAIRVDARIVGATNANLKSLADDGRFMRDLLDRLSFEVVFLPPLRERKEDILLLAEHFAGRMAVELGRDNPPVFSDRVIKAMENHPWRGNVRELKNVVERAVYRCAGDKVKDIEFDPFRSPYAPTPVPIRKDDSSADSNDELCEDVNTPEVTLDKPFPEAVRDYEIGLICKALEETRYNQRQAADRLGLTYHQFRGLYRKYADVLDEG